MFLLISPLACGAGVLAIGTAFGFAHAMIFSHLDTAALFSRATIRKDFFLSVDGGMVGLSGPAWRSGINMILIAGGGMQHSRGDRVSRLVDGSTAESQ